MKRVRGKKENQHLIRLTVYVVVSRAIFSYHLYARHNDIPYFTITKILRHENRLQFYTMHSQHLPSNQGPFFSIKFSSPFPHSLSPKGNVSHSTKIWRRLVISCVATHWHASGDTTEWSRHKCEDNSTDFWHSTQRLPSCLQGNTPAQIPELPLERVNSIPPLIPPSPGLAC